jgi:hypothetical protein
VTGPIDFVEGFSPSGAFFHLDPDRVLMSEKKNIELQENPYEVLSCSIKLTDQYAKVSFFLVFLAL